MLGLNYLHRHFLLLLLLLLLPLPALSSYSNYSTTSTKCPYDLDTATHLIPADCYANSTTTSVSTTSCCWYVFAAYLYAAIRYSNLTGAAFLPPASAAACSCSFSSLLLLGRFVPLGLLLNSSSCNLAGNPLHLAAGSRPCQFPSVSAIRSAVDFSSPIRSCTSRSKDLGRNSDCVPCQKAVISATFSLFDVTGSKEFVPCGMAATIGVWSGSAPSIPRFRTYALCMLQVLENVGDLSTTNLIPAIIDRKDGPSRSRSVKVAVGSAVAALASVTAIVLLTLAIKRRRRRGGATLNLDEYLDPSSPLPTEGLYIFTRSELKHATENYSDRLVLGEGGAGRVYLGKLPSGQHVAIKRIYEKKKVGEFYREVEILAKIRHRNLTTLVGYCAGKKEHVLVYEYVAGGNLARALYHGDLKWCWRVRIAADVAEGLVYLHELPDGAVVHRDVKPTNVLLTEDHHQAKLSDFGVSRVMPPDGSHVSTQLRGTLGYMDPESFWVGHVSESADVYSFGVVLLELVTGLKAVVTTPSGGAESIVQVAREALAEDWMSIVDPKLGSAWDQASVRQVFDLGCKCVRPHKNARPSMAEVLKVLKEVLSHLETIMDVTFDDVVIESKMPMKERNSEELSSQPTTSSSWSPV